ncbi:MAG: hypothetical protein ACYC7E_23075, partial [Armatimonadota bacterium]
YLGNNAQTTETTNLIIVPTGSRASRKIAFLTGSIYGASTVTINNVTVGGVFTPATGGLGTLTGGTNYTNLGTGGTSISTTAAQTMQGIVLVLPTQADVPIKIDLTVSGTGHTLYMAVEP